MTDGRLGQCVTFEGTGGLISCPKLADGSSTGEFLTGLSSGLHSQKLRCFEEAGTASGYSFREAPAVGDRVARSKSVGAVSDESLSTVESSPTGVSEDPEPVTHDKRLLFESIGIPALIILGIFVIGFVMV